jgi:leucyl-tRNA synthetase
LAVPSEATKEAILKAAKEHDHVKTFTKAKKITREVYVPGKLVNLVTA